MDNFNPISKSSSFNITKSLTSSQGLVIVYVLLLKVWCFASKIRKGSPLNTWSLYLIIFARKNQGSQTQSDSRPAWLDNIRHFKYSIFLVFAGRIGPIRGPLVLTFFSFAYSPVITKLISLKSIFRIKFSWWLWKK